MRLQGSALTILPLRDRESWLRVFGGRLLNLRQRTSTLCAASIDCFGLSLGDIDE
jgi:hypothetical protein